MKIRTQLILVLLVLAVLPLTSIVLYSYTMSLRAVRAAEEAEATTMAARLESRLAETQREVERRVRGLDGMRLAGVEDLEGHPTSGAEMAKPLAQRVLMGLGDSAPFVSHIEFLPQLAPSPSAAPEPTAPPSPPDSPGGDEVAGRVATTATRSTAPAVPVVVDVNAILDEIKVVNGLEDTWRLQALKEVDQALRAVGRVRVGSGELEGEPAAEGSKESSSSWDEAFGVALGQAIEQGLSGEQIFAKEGFVVPVLGGKHRIGGLRVGVSGRQLAEAVLSQGIQEREGDIAFALDAEGHVFTANAEDRTRVTPLAAEIRSVGAGERTVFHDYVVATTRPDPETGISFGVARPLGDVLAGVRATAVRNLASGLILILIALLGVLPLARRMTRNLDAVIAGVERVAQGDLNVRIPVHSRNEFGKLAGAVNSMAVELLDQEVRLVEQERQSREQEVRERLLQSEYERKSQELEEARRFQLSLLPKVLPKHSRFELAVAMQTAAEVGGDYYDFRVDDGTDLTVAIGDATGHGARAGTMVTVIKSLFSAHATAGTGVGSPGAFLAAAASAIRRMDLGRMLMALTLGRFQGDQLVLSAAGMPPVLHYRCRTGSTQEISMAGMPLGGITWDYSEIIVDFESGDTFLFLSDGFPEAIDSDGQPYGYQRVAEVFTRAATTSPEKIIQQLLEAAQAWREGGELADDLTLVVVRVR
ncbi:MAG: SpoIIE family protein phosphatase [Thermoanaerobaculia bacterium]|nr:SpoIIE family protein phosphatase [Thermoanaerobaculia bacterium]